VKNIRIEKLLLFTLGESPQNIHFVQSVAKPTKAHQGEQFHRNGPAGFPPD